MPGNDKKGSKTIDAHPGAQKKHVFHGNQYSSQQVDHEYLPTAFEKKLASNIPFSASVVPEHGYRILNFVAVFSAIGSVVKCKECNGDITFSESCVKGLGFKIRISCDTCKDREVASCPIIRENSYEINHRIVFAMRLLGIGLVGLREFCGIMDFPKPIAQTTYDSIMGFLLKATKTVADTSMFRAAQEEVTKTKDDEGISVSGDGSWMKRGFSSLFGIVTVIGVIVGKVIDSCIKSSYCKMCEAWEPRSGTEEYFEWLENHPEECKVSHEGSAGKMEADGIVELFQRSEERYNVKYSNYIGDGDSKAYKAIEEACPYGKNSLVPKKECIGHVQKRMGTKLRKVKQEIKGIGGKRKLTAKLIDQLNVYYGNAIRNNCDSVEAMKTAIWATYYHKCFTDNSPQHKNCPSGEFSWCSWQRAKAAGDLAEYHHKPELHSDVQKAIYPIYTSLSNEELLKRCIEGFTQNNNESLPSKIWKIAPKTSSCGADVVKIATFIAVSTFNDGKQSLLRIMDEMQIIVGPNAKEMCSREDDRRILQSIVKASTATKEARTEMQIKKKARLDAATASEGALYSAGTY